MRNEKKVTFCDVIDFTLEELLALRFNAQIASRFERAYLEILIDYLQGNCTALERVIASLLEADFLAEDFMFLDKVSRLRLQIRQHKIDSTLVGEAIRMADFQHSERRAEIYFVVALAFETTGDFDKMRDFYRRAAVLLEEIGAEKKAVKALLNYIAAESRIDMERKLVSEYSYVYRKAKKVKAYGVAGTALLNISREYQKVGAWIAALKHCNRAIALLHRDNGLVSYYMALVHRCHLFLQLGRIQEAQLDYDQVRVCPFPEAQSALKVVEKTLADANAGDLGDFGHPLTPTWKERLREAQGVEAVNEKLSPMEDQLILLIGERPREKNEIISLLWGDRLDFSSAERRFHNLLSRLRKKRPGLVLFSGASYRLADQTLLPGTLRKAV